MNTYSAVELAEIIENHRKWLDGEEGGDRARLDGARLVGARLDRARLVGASLVGARLDGARLVGARLDRARLDGASLDGARLDGASLDGARLDGASLEQISSLRACTGNLREIKSIQCDLWPVTYTAELMQIGCQFHTLAEWWAFTSDEINDMDSEASDWWSIWKPLLQKIIEVSPAKPTVKSE